ncbi:betaine-aldehyde dehydrogenase Atd3 [Schizosaccharomyces pombe]|uniref:Probable betaine aldehyde dehydrogenase n=1 Tax=Schizosaccharomyces pombe (strain 972 / ATCC 24843) TaxID=284812 RepID=BADH_SCHPO|nr:putative aldehyde dehydrogenase Meu8 [Schizosaccharomyces pombe]O59808.1 RecName: Full=Probable betaine aldehyde dehydrogenase; Short=BADH; AltName: Full=Meiotic expression up-regulated protein 8 [Schizosaccharomyces pombe 972h-]CAA19114.1 aldehyde dehydrogenase Meu8 (predicted) [Schizosaccharomyces pombe]|eukprot:NP_588102.1 putative aldehyde dehydrogenase Meu8 [Schizosaccharomyces pombe]
MTIDLNVIQSDIISARRAPENSLFIDGKFVSPIEPAAKPIPLINPATEEIIGTCANASAKDVDSAVENAYNTFRSGIWAKWPGKQRGLVLRKIAKMMREKRELLAGIDTINCGKPTPYALFDIDSCADMFEYYAEVAETDNPTVKVPLPNNPGFCAFEKRFPRGVIGVITPWNFPLKMALWKLVPAIASGNCVVLKPSELAPWSCLEFALICKEAGLPDGVLNVIIGSGKESGAALSCHPKIAYLAFTGSLATGKKIMHAAAENIVPLTLELGGKSPLIICEDADLSLAIPSAAFAIFFNQGEACTAASRLIVHESVADEVLGGLVSEANKLIIGNGLDPQVTLGPVVSKTQFEKIVSYIQSAINEGCKCVVGGLPRSEQKGYFIPPTVFTNVQTHNKIWREEIFGPVLAVKTFHTNEEALELANDSEYGLGSGVFSTNPKTLEFFSNNIEAGMCSLNNYHVVTHELPWIGWKHSGLGVGLSKHGYNEYMRLKQITQYVG